MKKRISIIITFLSVFAVMAQNSTIENLENIYKKTEKDNTEGMDFYIEGSKPGEAFKILKYSEIISQINVDGVFTPGLPVLNVSSEVIKNKILPSPNTAESKKYSKHVEYMQKLYVLSCKWRQDGQKEDELAKKIMSSLKWYFLNYAPERPYWRLTFRFGNYDNGKLDGPLLTFMDRTVMNMLPYWESNKLTPEQKTLFYTLVDYSDHIINNAVGAQNRGVNWALRFNQITFHFLLKYKLYGNSAIEQLRYHMYDGFEYDPSRNNSEGMGTLTDGGFWHHGAKPYCLPYGTGDYVDSTNYLHFVEGTPMEFEKIHYKTYEEQLLKKWQYVIYNNEWFDLAIVGGKNACQTTKTKAKVNPGTLLEFTEDILKLKKEKLNYYDEELKLKEALLQKKHESTMEVNVAYWKWEYMLQRRPGWYIGFKGISKETETSEWDQNFHLASGCTSILRRGNEYWNVRPALRWTALPGITAEQLPYQKILQKTSGGSSSYCNGASDGKYGVFSFNLEHENTDVGTISAKKSAFFFDKGVVNLTTDIHRVNAGSGAEIWTSLDNRELAGNVVAQINGKTMTFNTNELPQDLTFTLHQTSWVWHDSIGYIIPVVKGEKINIKLILENRSGVVNEVLPHNTDKKYSYNTFLLSINHGTQPNNDKAQYIALPSVSIKDLNEKVYEDYVVVENNENVQLVFDKKNQIVEFAFRNEGTVDVPGFGTIKAFSPIVGTMHIQGNEFIVSVANPNKNKLSNDSDDGGNAAIQIAVSKKLSGDNIVYNDSLKQSVISIPATTKLGYEGQSVIMKAKM